jgi:hypothetical protein
MREWYIKRSQEYSRPWLKNHDNQMLIFMLSECASIRCTAFQAHTAFTGGLQVQAMDHFENHDDQMPIFM